MNSSIDALNPLEECNNQTLTFGIYHDEPSSELLDKFRTIKRAKLSSKCDTIKLDNIISDMAMYPRNEVFTRPAGSEITRSANLTPKSQLTSSI